MKRAGQPKVCEGGSVGVGAEGFLSLVNVGGLCLGPIEEDSMFWEVLDQLKNEKQLEDKRK